MFYNYLNNRKIYDHACNPSHFCDYPTPVVEESEEDVVTPEEEATEDAEEIQEESAE